MKMCSNSKETHYQRARFDDARNSSTKPFKKYYQNQSNIVLKNDINKKTTSQATCFASLLKRIFYNFWLPKGTQKSIKIHQKALTIIGTFYFWALRVAISRCAALRARFCTDLGRIWDRFWPNLGPILDNFWNIKLLKEQHHITWNTYIHTCIHFATTNRLGQAECAKRLNHQQNHKEFLKEPLKESSRILRVTREHLGHLGNSSTWVALH